MTKMIAELIEQRFGLPSAAGHDAPAEGELAAILSHRTHRRYTDTPISEDLMQQVLAAGLSAPAKSDLQQVAVLRVENAGIRHAMAELLPSTPWVAQAAQFLVICGDSHRIRRICELRGIPFANDHLDAFLNAASDAAMVLQNLIRAASAAGLGACPISVIRNHATRIAELLALPDHVFPLAGLCLGWPSHEGFVSMRLPTTLTVHVDHYDDTKLEAEIDDYDRRRNARHSIPESDWRQVELFGRPTFYGWSEDKARQVSVPERQDFGAFVRRQGFKLDQEMTHGRVAQFGSKDCPPPANHFIMPASRKRNAANMTEGANGLYP
jgi:nitroreductase/FMN reductase [NAD(P)H]